MIADIHLNPAAVELGAFFPQPPDVVWRALTEPDLLQQWLLRPTGFTTTVGTHFRFTTPDSSIDEILCQVLAAHPRKQLTYTWTYPRADYPTRWTVDWTAARAFFSRLTGLIPKTGSLRGHCQRYSVGLRRMGGR
ncbi:SRPBCC domain-containing protein [Nocardia tengchongensis]|uniref:SRPBCC family protein n=1 Tax=Nocardia tengchongensis TaxID=2055889 RepID=UPI0033CDB28D